MKQGMPGEDRPLPGEVQELFRSYRESLTDIDASTTFMPGLWARIDGRRRVTHSFGRFAGAFVTAAFLICLALSTTLMSSQPTGAYHSSYVDVLADDTSDDDLEVQLASAEMI